MSETLLTIWNQVREVPKEAQKKITGGRLNGKTDINPVWRLKTLTGLFGPCGIGWKYEIVNQWLERGNGNEVAAFVTINLFIRHSGQWSDAIPGTGGSMFVVKESKGLYTSDECYKMALTDAISVACKALGIGADIYFAADRSKYDQNESKPEIPNQEPSKSTKITNDQIKELAQACMAFGDDHLDAEKARLKEIYTKRGYKSAKEIEQKDYDEIKREFVEYGFPFQLN